MFNMRNTNFVCKIMESKTKKKMRAVEKNEITKPYSFAGKSSA